MVLAIAAMVIFTAYRCAKILNQRYVRGLEPTVPEAALNMVQNLKVEEQTMEKFLQIMTKEKPVRFTTEQLSRFTNNYSTKLGSGGFGVVYRGQFPNGVKIAVKILNPCLNKRVEAQFMAEVGTIGGTYHINLVRLFGLCYDQTIAALVYEYMENGSLDKYLFTETEVIKWEKLHKIAVETARGIAYLHEECQQRIVHYDIKPANILLDAKFSAKVADFGLAKLCNPKNTQESVSSYRGTPGYSAPEFFLRNYPITHKCDVYSFGMLLFEIIGRRRNAQDTSSDTLDWFPKQVWDEYEKGELSALVMACGIGKEDREKAERMSIVALWCAQDSPEGRPPMSAVVKMLEGGDEIVAPPKPFRYLYSIGMDALKSPCKTGNAFGSSKGNEGGESSCLPRMEFGCLVH
ncbi:Kinase [Melia azedarach]|uniref:Kinase n=1 Tax=Melia azedarach TaxID=155640 RepID=A0ACC1X8F8_MELAZ|nr:Kinase [Melia azedarach]